MASDLNTFWTPATVLTYTDPLATVVRKHAAQLGLGAPGEVDTLTSDFYSALVKILGDGTTTNPGIGQPESEARVREPLEASVRRSRYDLFFAQSRDLMVELDRMVSARLPNDAIRGAWTMTDSTYLHAFDTYLLRANATAAPTVGVPGTAPVLTAISSDANGHMPEVSGAARPYFVYTYVGASDWMESLPCAEVQCAALADPAHAQDVAIAGNVPANVTKVRCYRSLYNSGAAATKYWIKDVAAVAGAAHPTIHLLESDIELRDYRPPSWLQCLLLPEAALLFALAFSMQQGGGQLPLQFTAAGMLSPQNVVLIPSNGILGLGNVAQHGLFGTYLETGPAWTAGGIQTANNPGGGVQGFAGALGTGTGGLRARATAALSTAGTITIDYTYYGSATGWGSVQSASALVSDAFTGTAVGSTATFDIPSGRLVRTVTPVSSTPTTGGWLVEAEASRVY